MRLFGCVSVCVCQCFDVSLIGFVVLCVCGCLAVADLVCQCLGV